MIFNLGAKEFLGVIDSDNTKLIGSYEGALKINEIHGGVMSQGENPSPTNPQEIRNVSISGIKTHGKNFYNPNTHATGNTTLAIMGGIKADSSDAELIKSGEYTISYNCDENVSLFVVDYNKNNVIVNGTTKKSVTFAIPNDTRVNIFLYSGTGVNGIVDIQLEKGTVATPYEPYTESSITFTQPIELYGIDGKLDNLTGKQINRKFKKVVFSGDESWLASSFSKRYYVDGLNCKAFGVVFCSHAKGLNGEATDPDECYLSGSSNGLFVINTSFTTVTQFKAWLSSNPMTVIYELAEETVEELLTPDQIALSRIKTMNDMTYVEFISEVQPTLLKSEYATNAVGVVALNAWADNELGMARGLVNKAEDESQTFTVKIEHGLVYLYKDDVLHGIVGANVVNTNGSTYKTMNVRAEKDADFISLTNKTNGTSYYMNINNVPITANQYRESHYFNGNTRIDGGIWSNETHINKLGVNGGVAQAVEWVWDAALGRYVLCTVQ